MNKITQKDHENLPNEARCTCGQLVAKLNDHGVELKCKRCKRIVSIPLSSLHDSEIIIEPCTAH
jgi:phage FluMu protein Com